MLTLPKCAHGESCVNLWIVSCDQEAGSCASHLSEAEHTAAKPSAAMAANSLVSCMVLLRGRTARQRGCREL